MRKLKKAIIGVLASAMLMGAMTGCGKAASDDITVISREDGSGTRGAFIELFGIEDGMPFSSSILKNCSLIALLTSPLPRIRPRFSP